MDTQCKPAYAKLTCAGWQQENGASFEGSMLKLLRTLPKVLKYLPSDKAADARSFMMSFQVCETLDATHTHLCAKRGRARTPPPRVQGVTRAHHTNIADGAA